MNSLPQAFTCEVCTEYLITEIEASLKLALPIGLWWIQLMLSVCIKRMFLHNIIDGRFSKDGFFNVGSSRSIFLDRKSVV